MKYLGFLLLLLSSICNASLEELRTAIEDSNFKKAQMIVSSGEIPRKKLIMFSTLASKIYIERLIKLIASTIDPIFIGTVCNATWNTFCSLVLGLGLCIDGVLIDNYWQNTPIGKMILGTGSLVIIGTFVMQYINCVRNYLNSSAISRMLTFYNLAEEDEQNKTKIY